MVTVNLLHRFPYFAGVNEWILEDIAALSEERVARTGEVLFRDGEPASHLYFVIEGEVDLRYPSGPGQYTTVDTAVAGDLMAWSAVVEPHVIRAMAVVRKNARLVAIKGPELCELMNEDPVLGRGLSSHVAAAAGERLKGVRLQIAARAPLSVTA